MVLNLVLKDISSVFEDGFELRNVWVWNLRTEEPEEFFS